LPEIRSKAVATQALPAAPRYSLRISGREAGAKSGRLRQGAPSAEHRALMSGGFVVPGGAAPRCRL